MQPGARIDITGGNVNAGCGDLIVAGLVDMPSGSATALQDVNISGGTLQMGNSLISLSGDWTNAGTFNSGTGTVEMVDGCGSSLSTITGDSVFSTLRVATDGNRALNLTAGSTQAFRSQLSLTGGPDGRLEIRSTSPGSRSFFELRPGASQLISRVDVADNDARGGEGIAPGEPTAFDSVDAGGNLNWFLQALASLQPEVITTLPAPALLLLTAIILLVGRRSHKLRQAARE